MRILGIDPGLATLGWGVVEKQGQKVLHIAYGTLETPPTDAFPKRLHDLFLGVKELCALYAPDEVAFEELFFSKNVTTGIAVSAARGAAMVAAAEHTDALYEYTPMQVKQAVVGYGKAEKQQVQTMVKLLLSLEAIPRPDDAADALAIAITHAHTGVATQLFKIK